MSPWSIPEAVPISFCVMRVRACRKITTSRRTFGSPRLAIRGLSSLWTYLTSASPCARSLVADIRYGSLVNFSTEGCPRGHGGRGGALSREPPCSPPRSAANSPSSCSCWPQSSPRRQPPPRVARPKPSRCLPWRLWTVSGTPCGPPGARIAATSIRTAGASPAQRARRPRPRTAATSTRTAAASRSPPLGLSFCRGNRAPSLLDVSDGAPCQLHRGRFPPGRIAEEQQRGERLAVDLLRAEDRFHLDRQLPHLCRAAGPQPEDGEIERGEGREIRKILVEEIP